MTWEDFRLLENSFSLTKRENDFERKVLFCESTLLCIVRICDGKNVQECAVSRRRWLTKSKSLDRLWACQNLPESARLPNFQTLILGHIVWDPNVFGIFHLTKGKLITGFNIVGLPDPCFWTQRAGFWQKKMSRYLRICLRKTFSFELWKWNLNDPNATVFTI